MAEGREIITDYILLRRLEPSPHGSIDKIALTYKPTTSQ
jgi:hypothetical protein